MLNGGGKMVLRAGLIGTGWIGTRHLNALAIETEVKIAAICDVDENKAQKLAIEYNANGYTDYNNMMESEELDFVLICTPPGLRLAPVQKAVEKGIACFIEKPPAKNLTEALEIERIIEDSDVINSVGFMYRYAGAIEKARELTENEKIPLIRSIYVCPLAIDPNWPRWFFNKSLSGGPLVDQAIHVIDAARYLAVEQSGDISDVQVFGSNLIVPKDDDFTIEDSHIVNLLYKGGTLQTHTQSWGVEKHQARIELVATDYHLIIDLFPEPGAFTRSKLSGHFKGTSILVDFKEEDFYVTELKQFIKAVKRKDQSIIRSSYSDAVKTLAVVLEANKSVENKSIQTISTQVNEMVK
jgi:predicted dehydrogenase